MADTSTTTQHPIFTPMRFFKSFSLLHRRSKSDTALTSHTPATNSAILIIGPSREDIPSNAIDITVDAPRTRPFTSFNQHVFEVELENQHLARVNSSLALRLALAETRLQLTMSELYAEMHKSVHLYRQAKTDRDTISELQKTCQQYRQALYPFPDVTSALVGFYSSTDSRTSLIGSPHSGSSVTRTGDEQQYSTALKLVLKTRQELRNCKKVAMFWKRKARTVLEHADLVTPSPSDISEVQDALSKERMEAVNALQRRRQMMSASGTQVTIASTSFLRSAPRLAPYTKVDGQLYQSGHAQSYRSLQCSQETWNPAIETDGREQVNNPSQNRLRRKLGSVDLRQSTSFASA